MHDIMAFLRLVVKTGDNASVAGCYIFKNGSIYAGDPLTGMQAGVTLETAIEFNVPAVEFDKALARMKEIKSLTYTGDEVTVKSGKISASIRCVSGEPPLITEIPETWKPFPAAAIPAIEMARKFIGEDSRNWMNGIRLSMGHITAFSQRSGIDIAVDGLDLDPILIGDNCAAFLVSQGAPDEYALENNRYIIFRWQNGRWFKAQLIDGKMPDDVTKIFERVGTEAPIEITQEWREAFDDIVALSESDCFITGSEMRGKVGAASSTVTIATEGLAKDHESRWACKVLEPIIKHATHWNPAAWPNPALFIGPNLRGVVVGMKK